MSDSALRSWVKGQLFEVLGFAESSTTAFVIALAKKAKSPAALLGSLGDLDVPVNDRSRRFASELLSRVRASSSGGGRGRAAGKSASGQTQAGAAVAALAKNKSYGMVGESARGAGLPLAALTVGLR